MLIKGIYEELPTYHFCTAKTINHLEGWFSDMVNALLEGETINNVCVKGKWPNITWNGEKLEIGDPE